MRHTREEVIQRTIREYELLDQLVENLTDEDWEQPLIRPETKDPWTTTLNPPLRSHIFCS